MIHHLSTEERRIAALTEALRVIRPGGRLLVYNWAIEQEGQSNALFKLILPRFSSGLESCPCQEGVRVAQRIHLSCSSWRESGVVFCLGVSLGAERQLDASVVQDASEASKTRTNSFHGT